MADYRKMWEELGMDVELHDQLCSASTGIWRCIFIAGKPSGFYGLL